MNGKSPVVLGRWLAGLGALVVAGTAVFHATGYAGIAEALDQAQVDQFWVSGAKAAWLHFSWHLLAVAAVAGVAMWGAGAASWRAVLICGVVVAIDAVLVLAFAGFFLGVVLLAVGALLLMVGAVLLRSVPVAAPPPAQPPRTP